VCDHVFEYRYRDANNFKVNGAILLTGEMPLDFETRVRATLFDGEWFIAEQVGIPALREQLFMYSNGPTDADHDLHECIGVRPIGETEPEFEATLGGLQLLNAFRAIDGNWDFLTNWWA
jgi:hypothetical protein